jgi:hypothetical protein
MLAKRSDVTVSFLFFIFYFAFQCQPQSFALAAERLRLCPEIPGSDPRIVRDFETLSFPLRNVPQARQGSANFFKNVGLYPTTHEFSRHFFQI